jgi:hypothetical protein
MNKTIIFKFSKTGKDQEKVIDKEGLLERVRLSIIEAESDIVIQMSQQQQKQLKKKDGSSSSSGDEIPLIQKKSQSDLNEALKNEGAKCLNDWFDKESPNVTFLSLIIVKIKLLLQKYIKFNIHNKLHLHKFFKIFFQNIVYIYFINFFWFKLNYY